MRILYRLLLAASMGAALPAAALAQGRGVITGQVTGTGGTPVAGANVSVLGTTLRAVTGQTGEFRIVNVPAGTQTISATLLGYSPQRQTVTVVNGQTATAAFTLTQTALQLGNVLVTATGREQSTREIGGTVGVVSTADVNLAPVASASQLLQGRVSGVVVTQNGGTTGGGSRVRIRGANSISLSNAPLIVIDGVRSENAETGTNALAFGVGGETPSRLNDIDPNDIETIEVLKGPAAAALYGTAAANGVLQITTKRGSAGRTDFRVWGESGRLDQQTSFPTNVQAQGNLVTRNAAGAIVPAATPVGRCDIMRLAIGSNPTGNQVGCTGITTTYTYNPLEAGGSSVFQVGNRRALGASVSGGAEAATYYLSTDWNNEHGVQPMNTLQRVRMQANTTGRFRERLTLAANVSYLDNRAELPQSNNALFGLVPMGLFGSPTPAAIQATQGFQSNPNLFYDWRTFQNYTRVTASTNGEYRPLTWLSFNGTAGVDRYAREDRNLVPRQSAYASRGGVYSNGFIQSQTFNIYDLTTNASATAIFNLRPNLVSTSALGTQFIRENNHAIYAFGAGLTPGIETSLAGATSDYQAGETNLVNATLSAYFQQQFAWRDRVFLNTAVRGDQNTAFGQQIGWIAYPSVSGSWVISDESFFPRVRGMNNLRLRAAYGQAGLRPGPTDASQFFNSAVTTFASQDVAAIIFNNTTLGNPSLRPETSSELELGFETQFFENRLGLDFTYYNRTSRNALVSRPLPPSAGSGASRFENIGRVDNRGTEYRLSGTPFRSNNVEWNANLTGSFNRNRLVTLGTTAQGTPLPPIILAGAGSTQRHVEGYPLGSYFHFPITGYADTNGDGLLSPSEVTVRRDTVVYLGNPFPKRELSFHTDVRLWKAASVSALLDYRGGQQLLNQTRAWRCSTADVGNCAALYDPTTPLAEQAAIVARSSYGSYAGFVENADFVKLREVAITFGLPQAFANRLNVKGAGITLAGRNLRTWTKYTGLDPEINYQGSSNFVTSEFGTVPPNRLFQLRLDANF